MSEKLYRIKPLVWEPNGQGVIADCVVGHYWSTDQMDLIFRAVDEPSEMLSSPLTMESLKAAAQRDYEQRLISAGVVEEVEK